MVPALRELLAALAPGETGVVVSHGAASQVARAGAARLAGRRERGALHGLDNCGWVELDGATAAAGCGSASYNETARRAS